MFLDKLPSLSKLKESLTLKAKAKIEEEPFDFELLNSQRCIKCCYCDELVMTLNHTPLSIVSCPHCCSSNFIPGQIKDYWLLQPLGGGGMGCVYEAVQKDDPKKKYAIKILQKTARGSRVFIETLLKEAQIGHRLGEHPHIIGVIDYGHYNNDFFSIMQYANGRRLDHLINSPDIISNAYILLWIMQILSADKHIYDHGYLYRDLKPENIIIDYTGNIKMFDFGLTLPIEEADNSGSDMVEGSPLYLPPERITGCKEDHRSEIYSLGMIMFHLFTKHPFYKGRNANDVVLSHIKGENIKDIAAKMPDSAPPEAAAIIQKMTIKEPSQRYQSFDKLAFELMRLYKSSFSETDKKIQSTTGH